MHFQKFHPPYLVIFTGVIFLLLTSLNFIVKATWESGYTNLSLAILKDLNGQSNLLQLSENNCWPKMIFEHKK